MDAFTAVVLFLFGLAIGSFVNVLALRYRGDRFLFSPEVIGGRSRCPHCKRTLRWFELVPLLSFVVQGGRCRRCKKPIGLHYPLVELLSGLIFVFVPLRLGGDLALSVLWVAAFETLLLITYVDIRLQIVPDELNLFLGAVAVLAAVFFVNEHGAANYSFFGAHAALFGLQGNFWLSHLVGALIGAVFFIFLIFLTGGKGMGWGDVKFSLPLGFLFGWPDILPLYGTAFIAGAIVGAVLLLQKRKTMKSAVPFVPFMVFGAALVFFFGDSLIGSYFHIIGL
jgi:leader peptidase (prepilin peptidase) / N-methyltransferase